MTFRSEQKNYICLVLKKNKVLAGFLTKQNYCKTIKYIQKLNILRSFQLGFHRFFSLYYVPREIAEHRPNCPKCPQHERKLQPCCNPATRRAHAKAFHTGADVTTKAQMKLCTTKQELEQFFHPIL